MAVSRSAVNLCLAMERMLLLDNTVQHYAWGSHDAIPALLGRAPLSPSEPPWAELWMGAHASAPSRVRLSSGREVGLDQLAAEHADELLGARVIARFGARLPFLFKVLAAAQPLSIQVHPDPAAARAGFERETRLGIPLGAPERSYRDASHKPELLVALGRFEALVGFRPAAEIRARLAAAGARELAAERDALEQPGGLARFLAALLRLDAGGRRALLGQVAAGLAGDESREAGWVRRLMRDYPGDPAAVAPLFLNLVELAADQALYLGAGVLHCYLAGLGLEIMASSDNVLRGGLTSKHIDVDELCAVTRFAAAAPAALAPAAAGDGRLRTYETPAAEFRLGFVELGSGAERYERARDERDGPEIVFSLAERCRLIDVAGGSGLELGRGASALVTAQVPAYRVEGEGGRVYLAGVP